MHYGASVSEVADCTATTSNCTRRMLSIMGERELRLHSESQLCTALHSE